MEALATGASSEAGLGAPPRGLSVPRWPEGDRGQRGPGSDADGEDRVAGGLACQGHLSQSQAQGAPRSPGREWQVARGWVGVEETAAPPPPHRLGQDLGTLTGLRSLTLVPQPRGRGVTSHFADEETEAHGPGGRSPGSRQPVARVWR